MDHPTSPSPIDRPAKRQFRVSQAPEDEPKLESHPQQAPNGTTIEPKFPVRTRGTLTAEFMKVVHLNDSLATPVLKLLDLYFCLWQCYVVKSAQKIRLEEQRQLQASNEWLESDSDILLQLCNLQASILWDRKRAVQVLCDGVASALEASDLQAYSVDYDLDLDLHAIWHESSNIPTPPPCLATDPNDLWQDLLGKDDHAEYETQGPSVIECLFYLNLDSLSGFKWTGPDPLSISTQASDIFLYMSALLFPNEVHWIEFRFVRFDRTSGETIGEDLFFLPRVETALGNLCRIRRRLLDTITWHAVRTTGTSFRLSLWPRMDSLPYPSLSIHSSLTAPDAIPGPTVFCA
ncbi:unnamed protein product [Penicillium salamii]|nr:unnamed protein product [Penicillium salamii]